MTEVKRIFAVVWSDYRQKYLVQIIEDVVTYVEFGDRNDEVYVVFAENEEDAIERVKENNANLSD